MERSKCLSCLLPRRHRLATLCMHLREYPRRGQAWLWSICIGEDSYQMIRDTQDNDDDDDEW